MLVTVGYCLPPPSLWPVGVKAGSSLSSKKPIGWLSRSVGSSRRWLGLGSDKGPWLGKSNFYVLGEVTNV